MHWKHRHELCAEVPSSSKAGAQAAGWRSRKGIDASRSRLGQAGAPGTLQKENQHPGSAVPSLLRSGGPRHMPTLDLQSSPGRPAA